MLCHRKRITGLSLALLLLFSAGCAEQKDSAEPSGARLFSWDGAVLAQSESDALFTWMTQHDFSVLYQAIPADCGQEELSAFAQGAADNGIALYLLTGDPQWGLDATGEQMCGEVKRAEKINGALPEGAGLRGVVMDVEPYLSSGWGEDEDAVMDAYASAMAHACRAARGAGLEYIACIPYYYDTMGHEEQLQMVARQGCTELAVMNYDKSDETGQIGTELALARDAKHTLTVIYEMQQPGRHGLTERNTYYEDGPDALADSWQGIVRVYGSDGLDFAVHEYRAAQEVWGRE